MKQINQLKKKIILLSKMFPREWTNQKRKETLNEKGNWGPGDAGSQDGKPQQHDERSTAVIEARQDLSGVRVSAVVDFPVINWPCARETRQGCWEKAGTHSP